MRLKTILQAHSLIIVVTALLVIICTGCSPFYVARAGYEEAKILLSRRKIERVVADKKVDLSIKEKLRLVIKAREFASELGLTPSGTFTKYSKIDRDVLVWVLTASPQNSLSPTTWWFPIVGRVPYLGFFSKNAAQENLEKLKRENFDVFLRPSAAYSTLGWFDDPILSTMLKFDDIALVDTVIHEIVHNSIWVKNNAVFNESLANFIGSVGAIEFYSQGILALDEKAQLAKEGFKSNLLVSKFIIDTAIRLREFYSKQDQSQPEEFLENKKNIFLSIRKDWSKIEGRPEKFTPTVDQLNNAIIVALEVYLTGFSDFQSLYAHCNNSLSKFILEMKLISKKAQSKGVDPFVLVRERVYK